MNTVETVEFPKLGLEFEINRVAFKLFGLEIYWYGVLIAAGFVLAVLLAMRHCKRYGIEQDTILDAVLYATPVAIIVSRLYYVAFNLADFKDNPIEILDTRKGGLAIYGAVIGAFLAGYVYCRIKKINFLNLVDFCIVYFPMAQGIGRWGNFINQEAYGTHTELPWGMDGTNIVNGPVHPTFLYEFIWNIGVFLILLWLRKRKKLNGEVLFMYLVLYGLGRAWIELLRTDSLMIGNLRVNFLLSVVFVIVFAVLFVYRRVKAANTDLVAEGGDSIYADILKTLKKDDDPTESSNAEQDTEGEDGANGDITEEDSDKIEINSKFTGANSDFTGGSEEPGAFENGESGRNSDADDETNVCSKESNMD